MTVLAILILVIFGPDRMPELARKAGTMLAKARDTARVLREDLGGEYKEILEPIEDVRKTLKEARSEIRGIASEVAHQVGAVVEDVKAEVAAVTDEAKASVDEALAEARKAVQIDKPLSPGGPTDVAAEESEGTEPAVSGEADDSEAKESEGTEPVVSGEADDSEAEESAGEQPAGTDGSVVAGVGGAPPTREVDPGSTDKTPPLSQAPDIPPAGAEGSSAQGADDANAADGEDRDVS